MMSNDYEYGGGRNEVSNSERKIIYPKCTKVPMTLRMLHGCFESQEAKIDSAEFVDAIIVAKLTNKQFQNNKEILTFNDTSFESSLTRVVAKEDLDIGIYYKFVANLVKTGNEFRLYCYGVKQIEDKNEVNDHLGQVMLRHLERVKGFKK